MQSFASMAELEAFLAHTDMLVMMLPNTPATKGITNASSFAVITRGADVVNVGRGPQLVLADLIAALDSGHLDASSTTCSNPNCRPPITRSGNIRASS